MKYTRKEKQPITNKALFAKAKKVIPGGVNSPVRSFKSVGGDPVFIKKASGSKLIDEEGKIYIDFCSSWGPMILGHANKEVVTAITKAAKDGTSFGTATKKEIDLASLIVDSVPSIEQVRLTTSGTEATMSAIRLARAYTEKNKIIKFDGAYHGHADFLLTRAGSGLATLGLPDSLGVPRDFTKNTIVVPFNNLKETERAVKKHSNDLAAIIVEPVGGNAGVLLPKEEFLRGLRKLADQFGFLLIFDEVITGFRLSLGGAQEKFNLTPDLTCLGKIIGGGLPIGAFGGRKKIMRQIAPLGGVYQAGTLSGNPLAVTAGLKTLEILKRENPYSLLEKKTKTFTDSILALSKKHSLSLQVNTMGSLFSLFFTEEEVFDYETAKLQNTKLFSRFFHLLLEEGIYFSPSGFETNFLSLAHTGHDLFTTLGAINKSFKLLRSQ